MNDAVITPATLAGLVAIVVDQLGLEAGRLAQLQAAARSGEVGIRQSRSCELTDGLVSSGLIIGSMSG